MRTVEVKDGALVGLQVIAVPGYLHPTESPAEMSPVLVDEENRLVWLKDLSVRTAQRPFPRTGPLPGYATRIGPWKARRGYTVVLLGPRELSCVARLNAGKAPPSVALFLQWLQTSHVKNEALRCEEIEGAALWYCSRNESRALFELVREVAEEEFFRVARSLEEGSAKPCDLRDVSWWLSRSSTGDDDIYLAAEGLRRAGADHWELLLREGLGRGSKPYPGKRAVASGRKRAEVRYLIGK